MRARVRGARLSSVLGAGEVDRGVSLHPETGERLQDDERRNHGNHQEQVQDPPHVLCIHLAEPSEALQDRKCVRGMGSIRCQFIDSADRVSTSDMF